MVVPDDVRKCVAFLGYRMADGSYRFAGSAFFLGRDKSDAKGVADPVYLVTAKHVIDGIRNKGLDTAYLRVNFRKDEAKWASVPLDGWFSHPTDRSIDVAIFKAGVPADFDHLVYPYSLCISQDQMREHEVGLGDEVFITGLFRHHHGTRRNIPIVRVGNLACMTEEKVSTRQFGDVEAYLIEARSIGGLSGSPAFLNLGSTRVIKGQLKFRAGGLFLLLGLIHGHYDTHATDIDDLDAASGLSIDTVNTGIAIVVPFHNIDSTIAAFEAQEKAANPGVPPTPTSGAADAER